MPKGNLLTKCLFGAAAVLVLAGLLLAYYMQPQIVTGEAIYGATIPLSQSLTSEELTRVQKTLGSSAFLERIRAACKEDGDLVSGWTQGNTRFELLREPDGSIELYYEVPMYSITYFSVRDFTRYHNANADPRDHRFPKLQAEIKARMARIEYTISEEVKRVINEMRTAR